MYSETGLPFPCFQNFSPEFQPFDDFDKTHKPNASLASDDISDYDFCGEGDLFKAPGPVIEEELIMGADAMSGHHPGIEPFQGDGDLILSEIFYECRKDLLAKAAIEEDNSLIGVEQMMDVKKTKKTPLVPIHEDGAAFQKSVSSGCLSSMEWISNGHEVAAKRQPRFLDFSALEFEADYGMRRAFSEGDIKILGGTNNWSSEERKEKLERYRSKKNRRNFGRKIKYACRKALADSQPRIRGRFAKTGEDYYKTDERQ